MLFKREQLAGIRSGKITLAFRRWSRPTVKPGGTLRTAAGVLAIRSVDTITPSDITDSAARRAGFASRAALVRELEAREDGTLYRIAFRREGDDLRVALRATAQLTAEDRSVIAQRLDRMDGRGKGWTRPVLRLIGRKPGTRAAALAGLLGENDIARFKRRVRELKELGLTESLDVGYRLSPRGQAFVDHARSRKS